MQGNSLISEFLGINIDSDIEKKSESLIFKDKINFFIKQFQIKKSKLLKEPDRKIKEQLRDEIENLIIKIFEEKLKTQKSDYFSQLKSIGEKEKIEKIGVPLKEWNIRINRGVLTGYNKAFIIDNETKEKLCREDPKSIEILKPILRGRDIGRYYYRWPGLWVIATFPSKKIDINRYPAVKNYLKSFGKRLEQSGKPGCRKKTPHKWFET